MSEQEKLKPTPDETAQALAGIEESTFEEEEERRRRRLLEDAPFHREKREAQASAGEKVSVSSEIKSLRQAVNEFAESLGHNYEPRHIKSEQLTITNHTDWNESVNFLDYLLGKAEDDVNDSGKIKFPLGPIKEIIIETIPTGNEKEKTPIVIVAEDWGSNFVRMVFNSEFPFDLMEANINGKNFVI